LKANDTKSLTSTYHHSFFIIQNFGLHTRQNEEFLQYKGLFFIVFYPDKIIRQGKQDGIFYNFSLEKRRLETDRNIR